MPRQAERLKRHYDEMAASLDVDTILVVDFDYPSDNWGFAIQHPVHIKRRAVVLSHPPTTTTSYAVAMHELGHTVKGMGWSADVLLDREAGAWEWALDNVKHISKKAFARIALKCMKTTLEAPNLVPSDEFDRVRRRLQRVARGG